MKNLIKLFLLFYTMTMGFFFTYALVWNATGHGLTEISIAVITVLAIVTEAVYILSIIEVKKDGK
jgi:hypothetical protein